MLMRRCPLQDGGLLECAVNEDAVASREGLFQHISSLAPPARPNPILQAARQVVRGLPLSGGVRRSSRSIRRLRCRLGSRAVAFLCR